MPDDEPFLVFTQTLFIALTLYLIVSTFVTVRYLWGIFSGDDPARRLLRAYLSYQLLTFRVRPLLGELGQIAWWSLVLLGIYWCNERI